MNKNRKFDIRSFISFGLLFSFIIMSLTGVVLYITPPGRVAKWVKWTLIGLEKDEWQAVHTIFSYFFLILGMFHIFSLNWKVIVAYIRKRSVAGINRKKELLSSLLLVVFLFAGTLLKVQPLQGVMDVGEYFTESWEKAEETAPVPHTEDMTIEELSKEIIKLDPGNIIKKLERKGLKINVNDTLREIGNVNGVSPMEIYRIISDNQEIKKQSYDLSRSGRGIGRKTLKEIVESFDMNIEKILIYLKESGIECSADDRIRDLAEKNGLSPYEFMEEIKKFLDKKEIK